MSGPEVAPPRLIFFEQIESKICPLPWDKRHVTERMCARGEFPAFLKLGRRRVWEHRPVAEFIVDLVALMKGEPATHGSPEAKKLAERLLAEQARERETASRIALDRARKVAEKRAARLAA